MPNGLSEFVQSVGAQGAGQFAPSREPEVQGQLAHLRDALQSCAGAVAEITKRLAPVLRAQDLALERPSPNAAAEKLVPLAEELRGLCQVATAISKGAEDVLQRLEL